MDDEQIIVPGKLRKYFTMLPNLYDDADLDPYEFRLLAHYVRVGSCWQALQTTADRCHMSKREVSTKRDSLAGKGWIVLSKNEATQTVLIEIVDVWDGNFAKYAQPTIAPPATPPLHHLQPKKNPIKNNLHTQAEVLRNDEPAVQAESVARVEPLSLKADDKRTDRQIAYDEFRAEFPIHSGTDYQKFNDLWAQFPDIRRHQYAIGRVRQSNPKVKNYYFQDFAGYDPDKPIQSAKRPDPTPKERYPILND